MIHQNRQLVAILFTDIVGYTQLMQHDEEKAMEAIKRHMEVLEKSVALHKGQVQEYYGDGSFSIFFSAFEAVRCAIDVQHQMRNHPPVPLRIGLHMGEILFEGKKVFGDAINIASRIQTLGLANAVLFSKEIMENIKNQHEFKTVSLGSFEFKNVDEPIEVFALTNEGFTVPKREQMDGKLKVQPSSPARKNLLNILPVKMVLGILAVLLIIGLIFFYPGLRFNTPGPGSNKSLAVLPFLNIGGDKENEFFCDGITEDIISQLSQISDLKVISPASSMKYKESAKSLKQISKELSVSAIMKGSFQRLGNRIKLTAELIDAATEKHLWKNSYENTYEEVFNIQQDVTRQIAKALNTTLSTEESEKLGKASTLNTNAYELYLKGRYYWNKRTKPDLLTALHYFGKSISADPDFARAYSGMADTYTILSDNGFVPVDSVAFLAKEAVQKALSLDSGLAEVRASHAIYLSIMEGNITLAMQELKKAILFNPNYASAFQWYAIEVMSKGKFEEAEYNLDRAILLDPLSERIYFSKALLYYYSRNYSRAITHLQTAAESASSPAEYNQFISDIFYLQKQLDSARHYARLSGNSLWIDFMKPDLLSFKKQIMELAFKKSVPAEEIAFYYTLANEKDSAFRWLDICIKNKEYAGIKFFAISPQWDPLRSDPRFSIILQNSGIR
jgi:TolB-like protein/class 3 adenylate cyclase